MTGNLLTSVISDNRKSVTRVAREAIITFRKRRETRDVFARHEVRIRRRKCTFINTLNYLCVIATARVRRRNVNDPVTGKERSVIRYRGADILVARIATRDIDVRREKARVTLRDNPKRDFFFPSRRIFSPHRRAYAALINERPGRPYTLIPSRFLSTR